MTGAELQAWRKASGISQKALATRLGVKQPAISRWEAGAHEIPPTIIILLKYIARQKSE